MLRSSEAVNGGSVTRLAQHIGLLAILTVSVANALDFDAFEIEIGESHSETILHGRILGGPVDDLVVINVTTEDVRTLSVYRLTKGIWEAVHTEVLDRAVIFVEVASLGGRDRILLYRRGELYALDPGTWMQTKLLDAPSI